MQDQEQELNFYASHLHIIKKFANDGFVKKKLQPHLPKL